MLRGWCVQHALYHHNQHHQEVHHLNTVSTVTIIRGPSAFLLRPGAAQLSKIHHNLDLDQGEKSMKRLQTLTFALNKKVTSAALNIPIDPNDIENETGENRNMKAPLQR